MPSAWIDAMVAPPRRLPDRIDDAIEYVSAALGVPVYERWTPATLARRYPSMTAAKSAQPAVFNLLLDSLEAVQFWHAGTIVVMTSEQAPTSGQVLEQLLRTLTVRFRLTHPDATKRSADNHPIPKGDGHAVAITGSSHDERWLARTGRFFNADPSTNTLSSTNDATALRAFLVDRTGRSLHTRRAYVTELKRLIAWCQCADLGPLSGLTREHLIAFRDTLPHISAHATAHPLGAASCARAMAVVKSLYQYWAKTGYITVNPALELGSTKGERPTFEPKRFLPDSATEACDAWISAWLSAPPANAKRNRQATILGLYRYTGVRLAELAWEDGYPLLHTDRTGWTLEVKGKGQRVRRIPLPAQCVSCIMRYRESRGLPPAPSPIEDMPLIHTTRGHGLGRSGLYREVKLAFEEIAGQLPANDIAGRFALMAASTHWLRHSYVHHLVVSHQVPLPVAQALAGHSSVQTTAAYALTDQSQLRKFVSESFGDVPAS
jgi:site-specific recombinase XerD